LQGDATKKMIASQARRAAEGIYTKSITDVVIEASVMSEQVKAVAAAAEVASSFF
jgi:hypothetical protein